jgi:hypothetical protein
MRFHYYPNKRDVKFIKQTGEVNKSFQFVTCGEAGLIELVLPVYWWNTETVWWLQPKIKK